jgi:uncharacterized Zn-binding protein involved in type VI secretion
MGKQAARTGDTAMTCNDPSDMPVGTVVSTTTTVLIDKMPAAKQGDKIIGTDIHIIMIPSPGGPVPTPLPHPFVGTIDSGCSTSVNIMGMPAATVDSQASNMPPHIPQGGPFQKPPTNKAKIILGSFDVMIGGGGGGGGGGASGQQAKATDVQTEKTEVAPTHKLDVKFEDKGGKPISGLEYRVKSPDNKETTGNLSGEISQTAEKEGNHEISLAGITSVEWGEKEIKPGDSVKIKVTCPGYEDGTAADIDIYVRDSGFPDKILKNLSAEVSGEKVETDWTLEMDEDFLKNQKRKGNKFSTPSLYFVARIGKSTARSGILKLQDWIELVFKDKDGNPLKNKKYRAILSSGEVREGTLDSNGKAKLEKVPPGYVKCQIIDEEKAEDSDSGSDTQSDS